MRHRHSRDTRGVVAFSPPVVLAAGSNKRPCCALATGGGLQSHHLQKAVWGAGCTYCIIASSHCPACVNFPTLAPCLCEGTRRLGLGTDCTEPSACIGQHKPMHARGSKRLCKLCSIAAVLLVASESGHLRASVTVGATTMWYDLGDEMGWCCVGLGPTACSLWGQCVGGATSTCNALPVESVR
jgi:hypothetical protein